MSLAETDVSARVISAILQKLPKHVREAYWSAAQKSITAACDKTGIHVEYSQEELAACSAFEQGLEQVKTKGRTAHRPRGLAFRRSSNRR